MRRILIAVAASFALAACGGGGSGGKPKTTTELVDTDGDGVPDAQDAFPNDASRTKEPELPVDLNALAQNANSLLVSDIVGGGIRGKMVCRRTTCTSETVWLETPFGSLPFTRSEPLTITLSDLTDQAFDSLEATEIHRGVSLASEAEIDSLEALLVSREELTAYAGWLDHNFFMVVNRAVVDDDEILIPSRIGMSLGNATGTNPASVTGTATWSGVMVGVDVSNTESQSNTIRGDADLTIADFADPELDVAFINIKYVNSGGSRDNMTWSGIPLEDGGFKTGSDGDSIQGKFYGPNHDEVGGIFERAEVIGAFGATIQPPQQPAN